MALTSRVADGVVALVVLATLVVHASTDSDTLADACYLGVLVGASVVAWIGAGRAPRGRRLVPGLIAAGISLTALGDVLWIALDRVGASTDVSIADPPWLASYVCLCAALGVVLGRSRGGSRVDVDFVIDALTIVIVSVLIFWSVSIDTIVADPSKTPFVRTVWAAYPIADAILLALVVRVLMSRTARTAIDASFAVGVCLWLAADIAYLQAPENGTVLLLMNAAWMVAPVLLARAAWRVRGIEAAADASGTATPSGWVAQLVLAVGPLFVPATLELVADLRGEPDQPLRLLVGTAGLITLAFVRTARLIRSEQRAHRDLEVARDAALNASRAKSMFLANMSHEIRTPLTTVLATGELLEDTPQNELQRKLLDKMHRSGQLLNTLIEGILDFSRIEAGQVELVSTEFDVQALMGDLADVYGPRANEAGIRFECCLDECVPRVVVGDPARLFQIVSNLLDNAVKFAPQGRVALLVRPVTGESAVGDDAGEGVEFVVEDNGIGIHEEDQASVFESFHQVDGSTTRRYGGTGLGLAICKELIGMMGGSVALQSALGAGSTFVVRLPLTRAAGEHVAG
ncbi:MAG: sensor histidine kinase, partial [Nocardioides sp.]